MDMPKAPRRRAGRQRPFPGSREARQAVHSHALGELAWQLGGEEAFALLKEAMQWHVARKDMLRRLGKSFACVRAGG